MIRYKLKDVEFNILYDSKKDTIAVTCRSKIAPLNPVLGEIYGTRISSNGKKDTYYTYNGKIVAHGGDQTNKQMTKVCEMLLMALLAQEDLISIE